ncbi:MAG: hypothetical protein KF764_30265 [Labilithrix sp.]|nr:hypothetical protein [Labilithrix sp.]
MGAARRLSPAPWTRPGEPRVSGRPSWIGMPRVTPPSPAPPAPRAPSTPPPSEGVRRPSQSIVAPSIAPLSRPSGAPSPIIQSGRELELESEVLALREEIARLAVDLASVRARVLEESEPEVVRLAVTVAARVVGRELATDPALLAVWIREGLAALPGKEAIVAVAPDVAAAVLPEVLADASGAAKVVVDGALRPGSCELREGATVVPVSARERIAAISDALGIDREVSS